MLGVGNAFGCSIVVSERVERAVGGAGCVYSRKARINRIEDANKLERPMRGVCWRRLPIVNVCDVRKDLPRCCHRRWRRRCWRQRFDESAWMAIPCLVDGDCLLVAKDVQDGLQDLVARVTEMTSGEDTMQNAAK